MRVFVLSLCAPRQATLHPWETSVCPMRALLRGKGAKCELLWAVVCCFNVFLS